MTALPPISPTPDSWEQLANTLVEAQTNTQEAAKAAEQALTELRRVAPVLIGNMTESNTRMREAVERAGTNRTALASTQATALAALQSRLDQLTLTESNLQQDVNRETARLAELKAVAQATQQRINDLVSPAGLIAAQEILRPELMASGVL